MSVLHARGTKAVAMLALMALAGGCDVPRSAPSKNEILDGGVAGPAGSFVVPVDDRVTRATTVTQASGFPAGFRGAEMIGADTIRAGDTLGLSIYENVDAGLLASAGGNAALLDQVQVDSAGFIFIPYAGRILAAGNTPEQLREIITEKLKAQTPDPQVMVRRLAGDGATVALVGGVTGQGVYPIERPNRTLSKMLATAGGLSIPPEVARITVIRGRERGEVWFLDLYEYPDLDIALRDGDRVLVERDTRSFTAVGATGGQSRVNFETQTLSALEAITQVGGLNTNVADPTGVFVLRDETAEIANRVLGRSDLAGDQRIVYVLDLTEPNGLFLARDFAIRDGDTVVVTEAPYVRWQKVLNAITGSLTPVANVQSLAP